MHNERCVRVMERAMVTDHLFRWLELHYGKGGLNSFLQRRRGDSSMGGRYVGRRSLILQACEVLLPCR